MKTRSIGIAILSLVLAALACLNTGEDPGGALPTTAPQSNPVADSGGTGTLWLNNNSNATLCYVFISSVNSDEWGEDWLGSEEMVEPGMSRSFSMATGIYDLMAMTCDEQTVEEIYEVSIGQAGYTWNLSTNLPVGTDSSNGLNVVNDSYTDLCHLYIGASLDDESFDALNGILLEPGDRRVVEGIPDGTYCYRAMECDGEVFYESCDVDIAQGDIFPFWEDGVMGELTLTNSLEIDLCNVYIALWDDEEWSDDLLTTVLSPGRSITLSTGQAEYYDILLEDCQGNEIYTDYEYIGPGSTLNMY